MSSPESIAEVILAASRGAQFIQADLQIHTPIDKRFKLPQGWDPGKAEDRERIAAAFVESSRKAGLSMLAITEHNDLSYVNSIREASSRTGITVFPGVEFSLSPGLHLIALFESGAEIDRLWDLIVKLGLGKKQGERFHGDGTPMQIAVPIPDFLVAFQIPWKFGVSLRTTVA